MRENLWNFDAVVLILQSFIISYCFCCHCHYYCCHCFASSQIPNFHDHVIPMRYHTWYYKKFTFVVVVVVILIIIIRLKISSVLWFQWVITLDTTNIFYFCCYCCCFHHRHHHHSHHQIPNLLDLMIPTRYHTWYYNDL